MARKSIEERVSARLRPRATAGQAIEAQLAGKTLEQHFREQAELIDRRLDDSFRAQAELIDRLFAYRFDELDRRWGPRFGAVEGRLRTLETDVGTLKADVGSFKKDMVIVREGVAILLKRG